ncbi:unnamed protein product [Brassica rapa subsp. trilocularis]
MIVEPVLYVDCEYQHLFDIWSACLLCYCLSQFFDPFCSMCVRMIKTQSKLLKPSVLVI